MATETKTFYPGKVVADNIGVSNSTNPVGKGTSNTTSAHISAGGYSSSICYWPFDVSSIPEDAVIDSVSCNAKAGTDQYYMGSSQASLQLYSGDNPKGEAQSVTAYVQYGGTGGEIYALPSENWTRDELSSARIRMYGYTGSNSKSIKFYFYGAELTVVYTVKKEKYMLKSGGAYNDIAKTFKKVGGVWIEQTELSSVVDTSKRLVNGGWIAGQGSANLISFSIDGTTYQAEEGMTWGEWVTSSYNTAGFYVISSGGNSGSISNATSTQLVTISFALAAKSDTVIEADESYSLVNYS